LENEPLAIGGPIGFRVLAAMRKLNDFGEVIRPGGNSRAPHRGSKSMDNSIILKLDFPSAFARCGALPPLSRPSPFAEHLIAADRRRLSSGDRHLNKDGKPDIIASRAA
jgi:hypothetical protein